MGYRLNAMIPNDETYVDFIELGKQYDLKWVEFNNQFFGEGLDQGLIHYDDIQELYEELVKVNDEPGNYDLYNLDLLKEIIEYAKTHKKYIYFTSF